MPMPRIAACLFFLFIPLLKSIGQNNYWQQELKYKINVELDTKKQQLKSHLQLVYINHSPDTLSFIWFHLWVNAYQNFSSPFYYQLVADNTFDKDYFKNQMGYIKNLDFKEYEWSSWHEFTKKKFSDINRDEVYEIFGNKQAFLNAHELHQDLILSNKIFIL